MRFVPEIAFKIDESVARVNEIYDILDKIKKEKGKDDEKGNRGDSEA